jgi:probable phosphoglycerate mutase
MRLFFIRHGETLWNAEGRFQGRRDTELSEHGLEQGMRAAEFLSNHRFEAIVTSPLKRALVTGELIAKSCGCKTFEIMDGLAEICHGDWEGLLSSEVRRTWPRLVDLWHNAPHTVIMPGPGGESLRSVQLRAADAVEQIEARFSGDVCVATHDAVIKVLLCCFLDAPLSGFWRYQIANCSLTIVELRENLPPRVNLMGDAHYLGEGFDLPEQSGL